MFSAAIIIFRETLEMALILGVVLAATQGVHRRLLWIVGGFGGGILGALLVAFFAEKISEAAAGMGQELFNAGVLFTAALVIGWTLLWMKKHAGTMTQTLKQTGRDVIEGALPMSSLSVIIGLAVLREGSEIVLFVYGMAVSGQSLSSIAMGSLLGLLLGSAMGVLLYFGLLKISAKYMFKVTGALMLLLVAGLASQGAGFLQAAGFFGDYADILWDSSWLLSDAGMAGKALHSLIGYSAQPTVLQGLFYAGTLAVMILGLYMMNSLPVQKVKTMAVAATLVLLLMPSSSYAVGKIYSPNVHKGELELEFQAVRTVDDAYAKNNKQTYKAEIAYGVTDRWQTEFLGKFTNNPNDNFKLSAFEWENIIQLTEQGQYWLDAGLYLTYVHNFKSTTADAIEAKLLLEKEWGQTLHRVNFGLEQEIGDHASGGPAREIRWSSRYRLNPAFEPAFEIQSAFDKGNVTNRFNEQEHFIGPAAYGRLSPNIKYEAAYLFGVSDAAANGAVRFLLEYEQMF
jgi:high-affinity iron transporter